jgi:NAD(P)-dependent dehydrogenase (short-subunit alcohol dehydrogenase family)
VAIYGDLSAMNEVVDIVRQVRVESNVLDVLVNNAGVFETQRRYTRDGFETTMAVNHFAPFLLTRGLLGGLGRSEDGRVINISSSAHDKRKLEIPTFATDLEGYDAYAVSKLANVLFTLALAKRLEGSRVTAYAVDPGVITTRLLRVGWGTTGDPVEVGARTSVYLATAPNIEGGQGGYFVDCQRVPLSPAVEDFALSDALWAWSEKALSTHFVAINP